MIKTISLSKFAWILLFILMLCSPANAQIGGNIKLDDTRWISIGAGLRASFSSTEDAAQSGTDRSKEFDVEDMRLYINAQIFKGIQMEFNTARDSRGGNTTGDVRILDAILKFKFAESFQVWGGRFLPPSDRSNLNGPYFLNIWDFPFVQAYPSVFAGRDEGVAVWGITMDGRFRYQLGAFDGTDASVTTSAMTNPNPKDNLIYSGRLTYNFWDKEPSIYYTQSSYYGERDILAIGGAFMYQEDGAGDPSVVTPNAIGDFFGWNVDVLMEKNFPGKGVVSLEGAYYDYDTDGAPSTPGRVITAGNSFFILGAFLIDKKIGWGKFQPVVRYQNFDREVAIGGTHDRWDLGLQYIIAGHNARISAIYSLDEDPAATNVNTGSFKLGVQLQLF